MREDKIRVLELDQETMEEAPEGGKEHSGEEQVSKRKSRRVNYPDDGDEETPEEELKKNSPLREAVSWVMTFVVAILVALVLKNFVIINATVPTGSMENTIEPGDDLFGLRLAYSFSEPQRGDIIIFKFPDDESEKYVKRVIGLPGERVTIDGGKIYIDNADTPLEEDYLKETWERCTGPYDFQVPEDCYLVLGDNRNDSYDARYWNNTYVTKEAIIGKAYMIYYPFSRLGSLYEKQREE